MSNELPDITIQYVDEIRCKIVARREIMIALKGEFSFFAEGYKFHPLFRQGRWDGRISMIDGKGLFYNGLLKSLLKYCKSKTLSINVEDIARYKSDVISDETINKLASYVKFPPYDYQLASIKEGLSKRKMLCISPTGCMDGDTEIEVIITGNKTVIKLSDLKSILNDHDVYIDTPEGISKISDSYRKSGPGKVIDFSDNTQIICGDNHLMTDDNQLYNWIDAHKFNIGQHINGKEIINITDTGIQEWYDFTVENETSSYYHNGIVHHNSGKSLIAYLFYRYCMDNNIPLLITVPSVGLVSQLYSDFQDYVSDDHNVEDNVHCIFAGQEKDTNKKCVISTWQSLATIEDPTWFKRFGFYMCDECFVPESMVLTPNGYVEIQHMKTGDKVINYCELTKEFKEDTVVKVHKNLKKSDDARLIKFKFDNGTEFTCTENHEILTQNGWKAAKYLNESDDIVGI